MTSTHDAWVAATLEVFLRLWRGSEATPFPFLSFSFSPLLKPHLCKSWMILRKPQLCWELASASCTFPPLWQKALLLPLGNVGWLSIVPFSHMSPAWPDFFFFKSHTLISPELQGWPSLLNKSESIHDFHGNFFHNCISAFITISGYSVQVLLLINSLSAFWLNCILFVFFAHCRAPNLGHDLLCLFRSMRRNCSRLWNEQEDC